MSPLVTMQEDRIMARIEKGGYDGVHVVFRYRLLLGAFHWEDDVIDVI